MGNRAAQGARQNIGGMAFQNNFSSVNNSKTFRSNIVNSFYNTGKTQLNSTSFGGPRGSNGSNGQANSNPTTANGISSREPYY